MNDPRTKAISMVERQNFDQTYLNKKQLWLPSQGGAMISIEWDPNTVGLERLIGCIDIAVFSMAQEAYHKTVTLLIILLCSCHDKKSREMLRHLGNCHGRIEHR